MPTTTNVQQVKLNVMTEAQYSTATKNPNEFYAVTDAQLSYNDLADKPTIGDATLTIQKNGTAVDTFTANATSDKSINITVPTQPSDIGALPDSTKYGSSLTLSINSSTYVVTAQLKDQNGNNLGSAQTIDLPLESVVVNGSYDSVNKKIVLTLQNGSTIDVPVGDLVAGLQTEITAQNKLSSDLVDDTNKTNKFVTTQEKTTWNNKQNAINDLDTIRSGASAGATAVQPSAIANMQTTTNLVTEVDDDSTDTQYPSAKAVYNVQLDLEGQLDDEARVRTRMDNQLSDRINNASVTLLNKVNKCVRTTDVAPIVDYDLLNVPVQYKGTTTQDYVNGYFYKFTDPVYSSSVNVRIGSFTVAIDNPTFISVLGKAGLHLFKKYANYWLINYEDERYSLDYYGITITGTVNTGDEFVVDFSMTTTATRIDVQPSTINSTNNYVPYRSSATAFGNSTLMYNSSAMAFTGKLHVGSQSPATYSGFGRFTIYDNTASQQVTSMALLNYGGGGGCGVAIDMYNTSANGGIPSGRFGVIDNGNYSGYLQLQVKKSGGPNNPLLPAMNIVPVPASNSLTTCVSFGQDEFNRVLFDLHKPEAVTTITDSDKRWGGSGTTYSVTGGNKFNLRLLVAVGDAVSFDNFSTEARVTAIVSNTTTMQITTDISLGVVSNASISVKKAYFKVTDESDNTKVLIDPYGKMCIGKAKPDYDLDVNGSINATTDVKINGVSVAIASQAGQAGKFLTTNGTNTSWAEVQTNAGIFYWGE